MLSETLAEIFQSVCSGVWGAEKGKTQNIEIRNLKSMLLMFYN